ncbi:MAG: TonB family protein [Opitutae bacterium]|nr:TonB family protein [Opitutae bacterium]
MGTVRLRVEIGPTAEIGSVQILENTGSALLAEGARSILRRAAATPLGTNALASGFQVDVPITYRLERR